jgi:hypothetical protein
MMNKKEQSLLDLQEILLWQELNKQLIELKESGSPLGDQHHKYLRDFSLDKMLFSRITKELLLDEVPLALITDLSTRSFVTLKLDAWNNCLAKLMPNTYILDIEKAQAGAFDTLDELSSRYDLIDADEDEDEDAQDEELFDYIGQYMDMRERLKRNLTSIISHLHELKAAALTKIMEEFDVRSFLREQEDMLFLDFSDPMRDEEENTIDTIYQDTYRSKTYPTLFKIPQFLSESGLRSVLNYYKLKDEKDIKPSIRKFMNHERELFTKETEIINTFLKSNQEPHKIIACSTSPFFFIKNPFPLY